MSFANPWFLIGLLAAGLPVLIHFLTRARPRRVEFPPYAFLVAAGAGHQSLHRLRTITVLTLRTLLVAAVVMWFARPFRPAADAGAGPAAATRVVLVVDASLSMRAVPQGMSLFARAQAEAATVLRGLPGDSEAAVVLIGATPRALLPSLSRNVPALHAALVAAEPTWEAGDPAAALALARRLLGDDGGVIYVFSDFQRSNWDGVGELPGGVACRLRPVITTPVPNVALTDLRVAPATPVVGEPAEVVATVFNGTSHPREETVRLALGDLMLERRVRVAPFGTAAAAFAVTFPAAGVMTGTASLQPDDLAADDTRFVATRVHETLAVLLVSDSDAADRRSGAYFLQRALRPSAAAAPGLRVARRHSQDTDRGALETSDLFVIAAPARLSGEAMEIIARRVHEGAALLVFLDGPTAPALATPQWGAPLRLGPVVTTPDGEAVTLGAHAVVADTDAADWAALRFYRRFRAELLPGRELDAWLTFADGTPALTFSVVSNGAAVFVNLPVAPDAADWAGHPLFPAMVQELVRELRRGGATAAVTPGRAWTLDAPGGDGAWTMTDPANAPVPATVVASGRITRLALPAAVQPGLYRVWRDHQLVATGAVNGDPRESDLRSFALENLKPGAGSSVSVLRHEAELTLAGQERPWWPLVAAAAAAFLGLEMLVLALWRERSGGAV